MKVDILKLRKLPTATYYFKTDIGEHFVEFSNFSVYVVVGTYSKIAHVI